VKQQGREVDQEIDSKMKRMEVGRLVGGKIVQGNDF